MTAIARPSWWPTITVHLCPVCHKHVTRTPHHRIAGHFDTYPNPCPGSFESFDITIVHEIPRPP